MLRLLRLLTIAVSVGLLAPAAASADNYLVTSCHDPLGQPNAAVGWVPFATGDGQTSNTCGTNGTLAAALVAPQPSGNSTALWRFAAPPSTRIVRVTAQRKTLGIAPTAGTRDVAYQLTADNQPLENCTPAVDSACIADLSAPLDKPGLNAGNIEFRVLCTNAGLNCTRPVSVAYSSIWVALEDRQAPVVTNARVVDNGEDSGTLGVRFDGADVGGGLYRALIKVDGQVKQALPLGPAPCADVNPGDSDPFQFNVPVPCPAALKDAGAAIDARSLVPGPHGVEIAVEDAAGNQTAVMGPTEFPRPNVASGSAADRAAALHGRLRMWFVKAKGNRRSYTSRYGTRVVVRGLLRSRSDRGIVGARIDVYHIRRDGKRRLVKTGLKSRGKGALTLILPNNVDTRTVEFAYRALRPGPITSSVRLHLKVRRNGRTFHRQGK
jgi:hypothetical protein